MRRLTDLLPDADKEDIITLFIALQKQNYCLSNTIRNLLKEWPTRPVTIPEDGLPSGISSETKD